MAAKIKELIKAATIARVSDKVTGKFLGFLVKSNHTDDYYQVTCARVAGEILYSCTCEAKNYGHPDCCHCKAVRELVAARKQLNAERDARAIAQREAIQPAYYQACAKAESRHRLGKAAFEELKAQIIDLTRHERYVAPISVEADHKARDLFEQREAEKRAAWEEAQARIHEPLVERFEKQREEAVKHGGFSLLKVA